MKIAVIGLGRMGMQITELLVRDGHEVIACDRAGEQVDHAKSLGAVPAYDRQSVVTAFDGEQVVLWLMIPAEVVEAELGEWLALVPEGSVLVDGGNSDFRLTKHRAAEVQGYGSKLVDVGTSGGIMGIEHGFSMMVGGDEPAVATIAPVLDSLAKPQGAWRHFGPSGAGHYVKMVHNAIEYGMMESLAEGYRLLKEGPYEGLDLAGAGDVWEKGSIIASSLNRLTAAVLAGNPYLTGIQGAVAESGEARWALEAAQAAGVPMPAIQASFDVRLASQKGEVSFATKLLAAQRNRFGGHAMNQ